MQRFIVCNPRKFSRLYNLRPWYWNSLLCGLISSGENFLQLIPFTIFLVFVPTGTHHCWVDREVLWDERFLPNTYTHELTSVIWGNSLIYHVPPFVSDRSLASISRCCTVIQGQWLVPLDPPDSDSIYMPLVTSMRYEQWSPSHGSQVLRPLNHYCWRHIILSILAQSRKKECYSVYLFCRSSACLRI